MRGDVGLNECGCNERAGLEWRGRAEVKGQGGGEGNKKKGEIQKSLI